MKIPYILFLTFGFFCIESGAQVLKPVSSYPKAKYYAEYFTMIEVESHSNLTVHYDYTEISPECEETKDYDATLQVGDSISYFRAYGGYIIDNESHKKQRDLTIEEGIALCHGRGFPVYIFRSNSTDNYEVTLNVDDVCIKTNDVVKIDWQLENDAPELFCGYSCQKAIADFRGRTWTAWYTTDIPTDVGPWKLHGLPGLILYAYDEDNLHTFMTKSIVMNDDTPINIPPSTIQEYDLLDLKRFNKMYDEYRSQYSSFQLKYSNRIFSDEERKLNEEIARYDKDFEKCYHPIEVLQ